MFYHSSLFEHFTANHRVDSIPDLSSVPILNTGLAKLEIR